MSIPSHFVIPTHSKDILCEEEKQRCMGSISQLLQQRNAVIIAHYYVDADIQRLAETTGGVVADSLEMAKFGLSHPATTLIVAGVKFMGETAKILSPHKRVLMPTLEATCSLDLGCPIDEFSQFCAQHPDRTVVVYANTSAAIKSIADWVVTSSIAKEVIQYLDEQDQKILWAPDRYLGSYLQHETQADMILWQASCIVHEEFKANALMDLKKQYPDAAVLVHPESPEAVISQADVVGSTSQLLRAVTTLPHSTFIVATDKGIFYKMKQAAPQKLFLEAPTGGQGATCRSCAHCPWMSMNNLRNLEDCLRHSLNEIMIDETLIQRAQMPLTRMINFKRK